MFGLPFHSQEAPEQKHQHLISRDLRIPLNAHFGQQLMQCSTVWIEVFHIHDEKQAVWAECMGSHFNKKFICILNVTPGLFESGLCYKSVE